MRGGLRLGVAFAGGRAGARADAGACPGTADACRPTRPRPTPIGPRELQNFSLPGTVTRPADPPPAAQQPSTALRRHSTTRPSSARLAQRRRPRPVERPTPDARSVASRRRPQRPRALRAASVTPRRSSITVDAASRRAADLTPAAAAAAARLRDRSNPACAGARLRSVAVAAAALALGAGGAFLFWRRLILAQSLCRRPAVRRLRRARPAPPPYGPQLRRRHPRRAHRRPQPTPPTPAAPVAASCPPGCGRGSSSTFTPLRCMVEDEQRHHRVRAGDVQFGQRPGARRADRGEHVQRRPDPGRGDRRHSSPTRSATASGIAAIPPLKRVNLRPQVVAPRGCQVRVL